VRRVAALVGWVSLVEAPIILIAILFIPIFGFLAVVSVVLLMRSGGRPAPRERLRSSSGRWRPRA
jgi:hypothetical protein